MPQRLIVRLAADFLVRWTKLVASVQDGDIAAALILATVQRIVTDSLDHSLAEGRRAPALGRKSGVSVYAVAAALGQSRETVRRKVKVLRDRQLVIEGPSGILVRTDILEVDGVREVARDGLALVRGFHSALVAAGVAHAPLGADIADGRLLQAANTFCLRMTEDLRKSHGGDMMSGLMFCALGVANTRHLDFDPEAFHAEFTVGLPDADLRPVTALALAAEIGLPRETCRRYLTRLIASGGCRRVRGGVIAQEVVLARAGAEAQSAAIVANTQRFAAVLQTLKPRE